MKRKLATITLVLVLSGVGTGQQNKPSSFVCPSQKAAVACHSFQENKVTLDRGDYVCFREDVDEYITIATGENDDKIWNKTDDKGAPKNGAEADGMVLVWVTDHGVENDAKVPTVTALGKWHFLAGLRFNYDSKDNEATKAEKDTWSVVVNPSSINIDGSFEALNGSTTKYRFRLDKSNNRFLEDFQSLGTPHTTYGRCVSKAPKVVTTGRLP